MRTGKESGISRREFARRVALVSAASAFAPTKLLDVASSQTVLPPTQQTTSPIPSSTSQAEIESRIQAILAQYGSRLTVTQKAEIHRLATDAQSSLDRLRAYPTENGDGPALYLHPLNDRPRKPAAAVPETPKTSDKKKP
jgi:hypothetical protein